MHRIQIALPHHKFSCAHMTVFPDGTKERLHGHNYTIGIALDVDRIDLPAMIPFTSVKQVIADLCAAWKEHLILARDNPRLAIVRDTADELEFTLCGARYVVPRADALLLPVDNISVEQLAAHVAVVLKERLGPILGPHVKALAATVEENPGQGSTCTLAC